MRLSSLAYAAILLVAAILLPAIHAAQHSSGGGGSSGGAGSHGSSGAFSSSSASSGSSHSSGGSSFHSAGGSAASPHTTSLSSGGASKGLSTKAGVGGDKKSSRSFFHPFRKTKPVENVDFRRPGPCRKEPSAVCPPDRRGYVVPTRICATGQSWNGLGCGLPVPSRDCSDLASKVAAQRRRMEGQYDPFQSLVYRSLRDQYEQCLRRFVFGDFGVYAVNDGLLFAAP